MAKPQEHRRPNGKLESVGLTVDGLKEGHWQFYHSDGRALKADGDYHRDLRVGEWSFWLEDGSLERTEDFGPPLL